MLFINYSSAFNNVIPDILADKLLHVDLPALFTIWTYYTPMTVLQPIWLTPPINERHISFQIQGPETVEVVQHTQPGNKHQQNKTHPGPKRDREEPKPLWINGACVEPVHSSITLILTSLFQKLLEFLFFFQTGTHARKPPVIQPQIQRWSNNNSESKHQEKHEKHHKWIKKRPS